MNVHSCEEKFKQDLERIYAKYSKAFHGSPELMLSTCDIPENVKLIETFYSSSEWKTTNEEDSEEDDLSDYHSDCSESFERSFEEIYPRSFIDENPNCTRANRSRTSASMAKTSKPICHERVDATLARKHDVSLEETVTLLTESYSQVHNNNTDTTRNREKHIDDTSVKQKLFCDAHQGRVEKLFLRRKGKTALETASQPSFLHDSSEISTAKALDSGYSSESCLSSTCKSEEPQQNLREASCGESLALSIKPADEAPEMKPREEISENKRRPRYRLVRRCSRKIPHASSDEKSFSFKTKDIPIKTAHCSSPEMDEVILLETSLGEPPVKTKQKYSPSIPRNLMYVEANRSNSLALKESTLDPITHCFPSPVRPNTNLNETLERKGTLQNVAVRMDSSSAAILPPEISFLRGKNICSSETPDEKGVLSRVGARLSAKSACKISRTPERHPVNRRSVSASPRRQRGKYHPYASCDKLSSPLRDLSLMSRSPERWKSLDSCPMTMRVKKARRLRDPLLASRKILQFGSRGNGETPCKKIRPTSKITNVHRPDVASCTSTSCTKLFCFACSMTVDLN